MYKHLGSFFRNRQFWTIGLVFSINAILFAFWITRIPEVKSRLALSDGDLGLVLFGMPAGALLAMLSISVFVGRYGAVRVTLVSAACYIATMVLPLLASSFWMLAISLFFVGLFMGAMDIAMNAVASLLEKDYDTAIMSTCHGFFSLGGMIGAALGSLLIAYSVDAVTQMLAGMVTVSLLLFFILKPILETVRETHEETESHFALPGKALIGLAVVAFCSMQGEGGVADWSAVYMEQVVQAADYTWGLAFTGFALSMTLVRFAGDTVVARVGARKVILVASAGVMLGLAMLLPALAWLSIAGFTVAGIGYALLVPIVFSEAGKQPGIHPSKGIAAVATFGYLGFLIGPVLIGGIAEWYGLKSGFGYLIVFTAIAVVLYLAFDRKKLPA